ncbi:MAG: tetratricopeptide repeat protein [Desulfobacter sp.]
MIKNIIFCALMLAVAVALAGGCVQTDTASPLGKTGTGEMPGDPDKADDADLTAEFYYLKSRLLVNAGDLAGAETALKKAAEKDASSTFLKREIIRILHQQKKSDQAVSMAQTLAAQDPEDVDNLMLLVRLKKGEEHDAAFSDLLKKILELDPENKETYLRLGKIYMETGEPDKALDLFNQMIQVFPDYYVAHFYLGESLLMIDRPADAEAAFLKTLDLEPELVEPRFRLVDIYQAADPEKNRQKILDTYTTVLEMEPENDRAQLELALFYYKHNQMKKADPMFARLGQKLKQNPRLIMTAVDAFVTRKRYEDAVIVFTQLRQVDPANSNLNFFLGMVHEALEHADKAIEYYLKVTPDHPQYKKTILSIAFLYRDKGNTREALRFLEQHHQQSPADIDIISYLASFYEEDTRYDTAITLLQKALKDIPDNTTLLFKLGAIQDKAGLRQDCINTMKALIRIDPDHASALNYLGYTYAEMGIHLDQALEFVTRALALKPGDGYITDSLGWVYYKKEMYDKAVFYLEKAAEISKFETIIADHLGDAYVKAGQYANALKAYQQALANAKDTHAAEVKKIKKKIKALETQGHGTP